MTKTYEVSILKQKFHLKTDQDEAHVKRVADYVNKVFHAIETKNGNLSTQNIAILGALNIAEEMFVKDSNYHQKIKDWKIRLEAVIDDSDENS